MKMLYLVRHAKAINRNRPVSDVKRPLTKRGRKDARAMAQYVRHHGQLPEILVSSPAIRALETARIFAETYGYPGDQIVTNATIYDAADMAEPRTLLRILHAFDTIAETAMMFGHDPLLTAFAHFLGQDFTASLPTSAVVCLTFPAVSWHDIGHNSGQVKFFHFPQRQATIKTAVVSAGWPDGRFELPEGEQQKLLGCVTNHHTVKREPAVSTHTTYYDTFDWRLFRKSLTLVETNGTLLLQSLKDNTVLESIDVPSVPGFLSDLPQSDLKAQLAPIIEARALLALCDVTSQEESLRILNNQKKTVLKLVWQENTVSHHETTVPLTTRLLIRPIRGYDKHAQKMARWLVQQGCTPVQECLYERALAALHKTPNDYTTKLFFQFDPLMQAEAASKIILRFLCQVMRRNEEGIIADIDTEFLHDFRVAVRRTRAALGQLKGVLPKRSMVRFKRDFAWLGRQTNAQRDLDVYLLYQEYYEALLPAPMHADLDPLFVSLRHQRTRAHQRLVRTLSTKKYADLMHRWETFLAQPAWQHASAPRAHHAIGVVAQKRVHKQWSRVTKLAHQHLDLANDKDLHALRIECKKLRYGLEFFASLFPADTMSTVLKQLRRLQDSLGNHHDLCVQQETLCQFAARLACQEIEAGHTLAAIDRLIGILEQDKQALYYHIVAHFRDFVSCPLPKIST